MRRITQMALMCAMGMMLAVSAAWAQAPGPTPAAPIKRTVANGSPGSGAGAAGVCLKCHTEPFIVPILKTPHAVRGDIHSPFGQDGCEACHGDSSAHVEHRTTPAAIVFEGPYASKVEVRNEVCLTCHQSGLRMNWQGSAHEANNKACNDCHTVHTARDPMMQRTTQVEKCFTCHTRQRSDSFKYSHHPMREGKVICSDCHNPHGSAGDTKSLKEFTTNETCYNCHAEKRGPMLWEHQPVRENCLNCHTPHGSNEPRLMKERLNFLCSACHSGTGNSHGGAFGGAGAIPYRSNTNSTFNAYLANQRQCLNCHSQVHGSNSPSGAFFFR